MLALRKPYNKLSLSLGIGLACALAPVAYAQNNSTEIPIESYRLSQSASNQTTQQAEAAQQAVQVTQAPNSPQNRLNAAQSNPPALDVADATTDVAQAPITAGEDASSNADNTVASGTGYADPEVAALENRPENKAMPTDSASVEAAKNAKWTLDGINNTTWAQGIEKGRLPIFAKIQVLLNRKHASPGAIDGATGMNTLKAISTYQTMNNLNATGKMDQQTWDSLTAGQTKPVFVEYTITAADIKGPYASSIPSNYAQQAKMKGLYYTRVTEMLGERFHMDENFLQKLNPNATFKKAGEEIIVANVRNDLPEDIHLIIAHKGAKQLYLFNSKNKMIASFPATIGSSDTPSPEGTYTVKNVAPNPWYGYNPKNFVQGGNMKPLSLPPGPNNPVGNMWIGLSKPSFGIHGTPNPSLISKTASHGCIRLTNWDANDLAKRVEKGITVKFLE